MDSRPGRYKLIRLPNHPLASSNGVVAEHRVILYQKVGFEPQACHFCGVMVHWKKGNRTSKRAGVLYVDHLNKDTHDNRPENLVPSCLSCNQKRRYDAIEEGEPTVVLSDGSVTRAVPRLCKTCGCTFYIAPSQLRHPNKGKYCSPQCMYQRSSIPS